LSTSKTDASGRKVKYEFQASLSDTFISDTHKGILIQILLDQ